MFEKGGAGLEEAVSVEEALLAVPSLVIFKILCDHVEGLTSIGEFFGPKE